MGHLVFSGDRHCSGHNLSSSAILSGPLKMTAKRISKSPKSDGVFDQRREAAEMLRAGLYARVSTNDQQTLPMQSQAMRDYAARRNWTIAMQVREIGSGAAQREARGKLMEAARRRDIDVVLVWRLDRWGRSVTDLLTTLQELEHLGVGFVSLTEALDLTTPVGRAMAGLLAIFAEFEREILREGSVALTTGMEERIARYVNGACRVTLCSADAVH